MADHVHDISPDAVSRTYPMPPPVPKTSAWSALGRIHRREPGIALRIFVTIISGAVLSAVACVAAWLYAYYTPTMNFNGSFRVYVRDEYIGLSFAACGIIWALILFWTWRGFSHRSSFVPPLIGTFVYAGIAILVSIIVDEMVGPEEEYLIAAVCLVAGAASVWLWFGYAERLRVGRPILGEDDVVNVMCPACGYSMVGLRELRCPECGETFAIDELIRLQGYGKVNGDSVVGPPRISTDQISADERASV